MRKRAGRSLGTAALAGKPIASVVIPAHNESAVIGRTLDSLADGSAAGKLDIIVVANACTDGTAQIASREGVRVLETPISGKAHALRIGDEACAAFPRIYLDADVVLTGEDVQQLIAPLGRNGVLAASPTPRWNLASASWIMRHVHKVHDALVAPSRGLAGVGVYVLGEAGHARAFPIPEVVISDDEWVERSFYPNERVVVTSARCVVRPATNVSAHLRRRVRVRLGNRQLDSLGKPAQSDRLRLKSLGRLVTQRKVSVLDAACYLGVLTADRLMTRRQRDGDIAWSTDPSSRS
jgi:glycosyltransferase involved in cell wall biosynthesis